MTVENSPIAISLWSVWTACVACSKLLGSCCGPAFAVGIGEAGGTPPSTSMLADKFPRPGDRVALTIFALGACLVQVGSSVVRRRGRAHRLAGRFHRAGHSRSACGSDRAPETVASPGWRSTRRRLTRRDHAGPLSCAFIATQRSAVHRSPEGLEPRWSWD